MTSREVADLVGKRHDNVLRDIDNLLVSISSELSSGYKSSTYVYGDPPRSARQYVMDKDATICLVTGYDVNARMRIIKRWQELEAKVTQPDFYIPPNYAAALQLAADQQLQIMAQQAELETAQPKIEFHDEVSIATGQFEIAEAARLILGGKIGNEKRLREWLIENEWVTRKSDGYRATAATESKGLMATRMGSQYGHAFSFAVVTPKGLVMLRRTFRSVEMFATTPGVN